jgi:hypothetical protein
MKAFAHWKNIMYPASTPGNRLDPYDHVREVRKGQSGPGSEPSPIIFIVDIPEGTSRDDVVGKYRLVARIDEETEQVGFEKEWPLDVRREFDSGSGESWSWPTLK